MNDAYYILSIKNSPLSGCALWWRPKDSGYTWNLLEAGRYSAETVEGNREYYDNGETTRAVKCDEAEKAAALAVDWYRARNSWVDQAPTPPPEPIAAA